MMSCNSSASVESGGALGPEMPAFVTVHFVSVRQSHWQLQKGGDRLSKLRYLSFEPMSLTSFSRSDFEVTSHGPMLRLYWSTLFLQLACRLALRYNLSSSFWTVVLGGIFKYFHPAARDIDLGACIPLAVGDVSMPWILRRRSIELAKGGVSHH